MIPDANSQLRSWSLRDDKIWRAQFVGPGGHIIHASLDMGAAETIARVRGGVEQLLPPERQSRRARLALWLGLGAAVRTLAGLRRTTAFPHNEKGVS